jgi:Cys-tRNA(Pro)/Cys-tRNA(Cys) deacylase
MRSGSRAIRSEQALAQEFVFINGGQRGLQVRLDPRLALQALSAKAAAVIA